ncbi:uncharacterized protein LOC119775700 [Cyprinodon tularosa]|uniref:uncharacterized protein LOC119775700 n=1 Tax=Cyprinodon tularosa TaxID=77115 RepID=UPI0018E226FF|nr:uncharacterized protein LOC119775700 [Cyprinodon tularosa]
MHLKLIAYCFGVPLLYTLSTISLSSVGWCEPTAHSLRPTSGPTPSNSRRVPSPPSIRGWSRLSSSGRHNPKTRDPSGKGSKQDRAVRMVSTPTLTHQRPSTPQKLLDGNCSGGTIRHVVPGKLYISAQLEAKHQHGGHQSAVQAEDGEMSMAGEPVSGSEESWQKLEPSVECEDDAMTLTVRRKPALQLWLDPVNGSSVPLVQLPPQCGYSVRSSWKDLILAAQYDACHVIHEEDGYVLPLLWRGLPIRVSCPVSQVGPGSMDASSLCCFPNSMTVKLEGLSATKDLHIKVKGEWMPLELLADQCGYTLDQRAAETIISIPFITCGVTVKDGKMTLLLKMGQEIFMLACPNPASEVVAQEPQADEPSESHRKLLGPLLFMPPFYLAPPFYPHPTYHRGYSQYREQDSSSPPTPHSVTPKVDFRSQLDPHPHYYQHISLKDAYAHFMTPKPRPSEAQSDSPGSFLPDLMENRVAPVSDLSENSVVPTALPVQVEAPGFQDPNNDFSSYYHYYHHPKIPLPGPSQGPAPGVSGSPTPSDSFNYPLPSMLPDTQISEVTNQISAPVTKETGYSATAVHPPFPFYLYYYPHNAKDKQPGLFHFNWATKANMSSAPPGFFALRSNPGKLFVYPNKSNKELQDEEDKHPTSGTNQSPDPVAVPPDRPVFPTPGFMVNADPYKYYYHPYYNYYLRYYAPDALRGVYHHLAQTSSESAHRPSHFKRQTSSAPSDPALGIPSRLTFPYSYYNLYHSPQLLRYYQELRSPGSSSLLSSNLDHSELQRLPRASEGLHPSLSNAFHQAYFNYISWLRGRDGAKEKLDGYMGDGQAGHVVFTVPDSMMTPPVAPPAPSSEDRMVSCVLQKLSSNPDVYLVPLEGCTNKQFPGQNLVHQLRGPPSDGDGGHLPLRLMVGCTPPSDTPAAVAVILRIATDASFDRFFPRPHLPLSFTQGKPVHVELRVLKPTDPTLVLLVHSCLAYTLTPEVNWILFYNSCSSQTVWQQLPSPNPQHIWRLRVSSFPALPPASSTHMGHGGPAAPEDPEVYFLCHIELCSTVYGQCGVSCNKGKI